MPPGLVHLQASASSLFCYLNYYCKYAVQVIIQGFMSYNVSIGGLGHRRGEGGRPPGFFGSIESLESRSIWSEIKVKLNFVFVFVWVIVVAPPTYTTFLYTPPGPHKMNDEIMM